MTVSTIGRGITLAHSTTSGGSYTSFAEILSITPPATNVDSLKVFRSDNTSNTAEQIPGWQEVADAEMEITYNPPQRAIIEALRGVPAFFKVTYPLVPAQASTGDVDAFAGFIKSVGPETPIKDAMKCKVKFAVSGPP